MIYLSLFLIAVKTCSANPCFLPSQTSTVQSQEYICCYLENKVPLIPNFILDSPLQAKSQIQ